ENDRKVLSANSAIEVVETLEHEDGLHYSLVSKFPIPGADGRPVLVGGMAIDITQTKRAEEALKEADQRKDQFLATLAHELRNPLAPLRSGLQVMKLARNDPALVARTREIMERQLQQMVRLIDDLLDVSRITRGKIALRRERISLAEVVNLAVEASHPLIEQANLSLSVHLPAEPLLVDGDPARLAQVFSNLLDNASKFNQAGGNVWLTVERKAEEAVVSVRDDGSGIPSQLLPSVFDMFTQLEAGSMPRRPGLGIGLALVRSLVEMHGGVVEAKSEGPGRGSEFVVRLSLIEPHQGPPLTEREARSSTASRLRILVVDDNEDAASSLAMMLQILGNEVKVAHDGLQALAAAETFVPQVILLDLGMPKMNGYDAARRFRELPWGRDAVLVAVTGWGQDDDRRRTENAGFNFHLVKPVEPSALDELLSAIQAEAHSSELT
ncbi:MAG TPA: ATP-binding protein, partial [Vicinamibacteria bacterium]